MCFLGLSVVASVDEDGGFDYADELMSVVSIHKSPTVPMRQGLAEQGRR